MNFHSSLVSVIINAATQKRSFTFIMRRLTIFIIFAFVIALAAIAAIAQQNFTGTDYTLELPSERWRVLQEPDSLHEHAEFIYGDRSDGYLRIRKEVVEPGTDAS